jgi:uncharacterized membrane protein
MIQSSRENREVTYGVLETIDEEIIAVLIDAEGVARVKPTIAPGECGRLGTVL